LIVTTLKILQLLGDFVPRPLPGLHPWTPLEDSHPQTPCGFAPSQTSFRRLWIRLSIRRPFDCLSNVV